MVLASWLAGVVQKALDIFAINFLRWSIKVCVCVGLHGQHLLGPVFVPRNNIIIITIYNILACWLLNFVQEMMRESTIWTRNFSKYKNGLWMMMVMATEAIFINDAVKRGYLLD